MELTLFYCGHFMFCFLFSPSLAVLLFFFSVLNQHLLIVLEYPLFSPISSPVSLIYFLSSDFLLFVLSGVLPYFPVFSCHYKLMLHMSSSPVFLLLLLHYFSMCVYDSLSSAKINSHLFRKQQLSLQHHQFSQHPMLLFSILVSFSSL